MTTSKPKIPTAALTTLRDRLTSSGWSAVSPLTLDDEGERLARLERQDDR